MDVRMHRRTAAPLGSTRACRRRIFAYSMTDTLAALRAALPDRYALEHELGSGGMARVFQAHDRRYDRPVAIKVLRPELTDDLGSSRSASRRGSSIRTVSRSTTPAATSSTLCRSSRGSRCGTAWSASRRCRWTTRPHSHPSGSIATILFARMATYTR
jgi:hypothetical protein